MHIHHDAAEAFYVLEGEYTIFLEGLEHRCPAGSFVYIPAGLEHGFRVGSVASRKLNLYVPAAMVGYFDELANAVRNEKVDDRHLGDIATAMAWRCWARYPEGYV